MKKKKKKNRAFMKNMPKLPGQHPLQSPILVKFEVAGSHFTTI